MQKVYAQKFKQFEIQSKHRSPLTSPEGQCQLACNPASWIQDISLDLAVTSQYVLDVVVSSVLRDDLFMLK